MVIVESLVAVLVPCYNEEESLPIFYKETTSVMSMMNREYEIILVNDGSKDRTLELMKELAVRDSHVIYISFSRNFGKEAAMYAGFCNARGNYVAVMDADMQDPPALLPRMLETSHSLARRKNSRTRAASRLSVMEIASAWC